MINNKLILAICLVLSLTNVNSMNQNPQNVDNTLTLQLGILRIRPLIHLYKVVHSLPFMMRMLNQTVPKCILISDFGLQAENWQLRWTEYFMRLDPLNIHEFYIKCGLCNELKSLLSHNVPQNIVNLELGERAANLKISWMHYYISKHTQTVTTLWSTLKYSISDLINILKEQLVPPAIVCLQFGENAKDWQPTWTEYYISICRPMTKKTFMTPVNEHAWSSASDIITLYYNEGLYHSLDNILSKKMSKPAIDKYYFKYSSSLTLKEYIICNVGDKYHDIIKKLNLNYNFFELVDEYNTLCKNNNIQCEFFNIRDYIRYYDQPLAMRARLYKDVLNDQLPHAILMLNPKLNSECAWGNYGRVPFSFRQMSFRNTNMVCAPTFNHIADIENEMRWQTFYIE